MALQLIGALAAGVCAGLLCWAVLDWLVRFKPVRREYRVRVPLLFKLLLPVAKRLEHLFRTPTWEPTVRRTDQHLTMAGLSQMYAAEEYVALRVVYGVVFCTLGLLCFGFHLKVLIFFGVFLLVLGLTYPYIWLHGQIRERHRRIQRALPSVLDLLTLSVEAGRDFLTALRDILQSREPDPLGEELERVFREVQLGKQRRQALRAMGERVRQPDLNSVVETLVQADELGVSIGQILRILSEQMRQKRFSHAEKLANESPVKLLFPLFIFIFPAVIIIMLGPILLRTFQHMQL